MDLRGFIVAGIMFIVFVLSIAAIATPLASGTTTTSFGPGIVVTVDTYMGIWTVKSCFSGSCTSSSISAPGCVMNYVRSVRAFGILSILASAAGIVVGVVIGKGLAPLPPIALAAASGAVSVFLLLTW